MAFGHQSRLGYPNGTAEAHLDCPLPLVMTDNMCSTVPQPVAEAIHERMPLLKHYVMHSGSVSQHAPFNGFCNRLRYIWHISSAITKGEGQFRCASAIPMGGPNLH